MSVQRAAIDLEQALGDPWDADHPLSFRAAVECDEAEEFPRLLVEACHRAGLLEWFVPQTYGGRLQDYAVPAALVRVVARRDLTAAIALGQSFLGSAPLWLAGSPAQCERMAQLLLKGQSAALALTEEAHGSDILASQVGATPHADGYLLEGEKWLINNATRGSALSVFARTKPEGGLSGFSLFQVHKADLPPSSYQVLPKKPTLGIRGADISGIRFQGARLSSQALIGEPGSGLECVLKALQVTRGGCASLSLGAADTALRLTLDFVLSRKLYDKTVFDIPQARSVLIDSFLDLLCCDAITLLAARLLHVLPEQMSLTSAVLKWLVPTTLERVIAQLGVVLGARSYVREGLAHGVFQKLARDAAVVSLFDGSTAVNLDAIALQLPRFSAHRARLQGGATRRQQDLAPLFAVNLELPPFQPAQLALMNGGRDDVLQGLPQAIAMLEGRPDSQLMQQLRARAEQIGEHLNRLESDLASLAAPAKRSAALFELSRRYATLFTACGILRLWLHSGPLGDEFFAEGSWLELCLDRLLSPLTGPAPLTRHPREEVAQRQMLKLHRENLLFSLQPYPLAARCRG
jgi:alkylation response protein AidB-like acyl-CoA dehydrogenase